MSIIKLPLKSAINLKNGNYIDSGTAGEVRELNSELIVKLYYTYTCESDLLLDHLIRNGNCNIEYSYEDYNQQNITRLKRLMLRSQNVKLSSMPKDIFLLYNYLIAISLKSFKDYVKLGKFITYMCPTQRKYILEQIRAKLLELEQNYIYPWDSFESNILVNPKNLDVQFVDLDDYRTGVYDEANSRGKYESEKSFDNLVKDTKPIIIYKKKNDF